MSLPSERLLELDEVERRALADAITNASTVIQFFDSNYKRKAHSKLNNDDKSDFIGRCEEFEGWLAKIELWERVLQGQATLEDRDVYTNLVISK